MEIKFRRDTAFRKDLFTSESFAHPAKLDAQLLIWIVERYSKVGDIILDPMFGSGTTMLACTLGRHVIGVELEQKFVDMAKANWEKVRMRPQLGSSMGECRIVQGDARQLTSIIKQSDAIITSPPYASGGTKADENPENYIRREEERLKLFPNRPKTFVGRYSGDRDNMGNLPYGRIDQIITSPPYSTQLDVSDRKEIQEAARKAFAQGKTFSFVGKEWTLSEWKEANWGRMDGRGVRHGNVKTYQADSIITSPPYDEGTGHGRGSKASNEILETKKLYLHGVGSYSEDMNNIGNLKSDSYLEAMLQVYKECYAVLHEGGLMILIVKNFIRNQKEVDLKSDTIKLCEKAGFTFQEEYHRILPAQSFWRVIYRQKYPDAPEIDREYVLVLKK